LWYRFVKQKTFMEGMRLMAHLMIVMMIAMMIAGVVQLYLGYVGIEDWLGGGWALGALALAFSTRIMLPLTIGTYLAMTNVYGYDWWIAAIVAAPGLLLIVPSMVNGAVARVFNK
jgi:hypothetical protein